MEEPLKFVGTYLTESLYYKFKLLCAKKGVSASKALLSLIMVFTKNVKLEEELEVVKKIEGVTDEETKVG